MRSRPAITRAGGFTLIELMISMTIMTVALLGMLGLYRSASASNAFARRFSEAHSLAAARLESLRPLALDAVQAGAGQVTDVSEAGVTYHVRHEVETDAGGNPNLYRIRSFAAFAQDGDDANMSTARLEVIRTVQEGL